MSVAQWLPPALRQAPDEVAGAPRLIDALLGAIDRQQAVLAGDIDQLWQDLFIESCAGWAVPYIGALLGLPPDAQRLEVAYAVALRRRKGTPAALEDFGFVVTGLTVRVIEGWQVSAWVQRLGHPPPLRPAALSLRDASRFQIGTPFERTRRSVTPGGRWAPRAVTAVVWPWQVRTLVGTEAAPLAEPRRFALHPLGVDAPLYLHPRPARVAADTGVAAGVSRTGDESDAPVRATYRVLQTLAGPGDLSYGASLTLAATHPLAPVPGEDPPLLRVTVNGAEVPWDDLRFGALPGGAAAPAPPAASEVLVDISRGHIELGSGLSGIPRATWHRPVAGAIGAAAATADHDQAARVVVTVNPAASGPTTVATLADAFTLARTLSAGLDPSGSQPEIPDVEIRLDTSDRLDAPPPQTFTPAVPRWRIVAPRPLTPTVVGALTLNLSGGCLRLEGFYLTGNLALGPQLRGVELDGVTQDPASGRVLIAADAWELALAARRCVLGPLRADLSATPITLIDSIIDGRGSRLRPCGGDPGGATAVPAVTRQDRFAPLLRLDSVTFAGAVRAEALDAVDCLFTDGVEVVQQQEGCLRHCFLGPALTTPPRHPTTYRCGPFPAPAFAATGFDAAGYYCLELEPDHPLLGAASDGGEVGAYHRTRRGARIRRLRQRMDEFVPVGLHAAVAVAPWEER